MVDPAPPFIEPPPSPGGTISHRSSFAENLRNSPRSQRHPSFTQAAVQELLSHPPAPKTADPRFAGRDWRQIRVGELVQKSDVRFVELDRSVEEATKLLIESGPPNVVLLREGSSDTTVRGTFDYSDLNAYLLAVLGLAHPDQDRKESYDTITKKFQLHKSISLRDASILFNRDPIVTLPESADLSKATEIFGSGVHRILICKEGSSEAIGVLSQLKLVKFLWDNASSFPSIEQLYPVILRDLNIGTHQAIAINGDQPLTEALQLMSNEGLTSLAVVDNALNVIGNISTADTKLLTKSSSIPLLKSSCIHFISVILSERGVENGRDSYPVFHVNPYSTLQHTVAKLVATRSHRMWVVESASPSPTTPLSPSASHVVLAGHNGSVPSSPLLQPSFPVSASTLPGARISGKLTGVISLTDILNLFARQSGLHPSSPNEQRARRRRSSSSSIRPSIDSARGSSFDLRR